MTMRMTGILKSYTTPAATTSLSHPRDREKATRLCLISSHSSSSFVDFKVTHGVCANFMIIFSYDWAVDAIAVDPNWQGIRLRMRISIFDICMGSHFFFFNNNSNARDQIDEMWKRSLFTYNLVPFLLAYLIEAALSSLTDFLSLPKVYSWITYLHIP